MHAATQSTLQRAPQAAPPIDQRIDELRADVVIISGGPGGSTAGALLAQKGWRVLLLEKDRHPRFHIGESLLPLNLPLFEQLGCAPAVQKVGLIKNSVQFHSMEHKASQTFAFADAWEGVPKYAYQVRRSEFDHALLQHARMRGVEVIKSCHLSDDVADHAQPDHASARHFRGAAGRHLFSCRRRL